MKTWCSKITHAAVIFSAFLFFAFSAKAQLTIGTVDPGPYTPGSTIAATFTIAANSCITQGNVFELYLSDGSGNFSNEKLIGSYTSFYSTYVNGSIPVGTPAGSNYQVRVKSTAPALVGTVSLPFEIKAGAAVNAKITSAQLSPTNAETFGTCTTRDNYPLILTNGSTSAATVTASITNEISKTNTVLNLDVPKPFTAQLAHYTILTKATMPDGTVGTKAYLIINNQAITAFATLNNTPVCLPLANYQFAVDLTQSGILNNFPGDRYVINWGDGSSTSYTYCEIQQAAGRVSHNYTRSSCGRASNTSSGTVYNAFDVTIRVANDFCGNLGSPLLAYAKVVVKPENRFQFTTPACSNTDITFINTSLLGENPNTTSAVCSPNTVTYNWFVDGILVQQNKPRSYNLIYKFLTNGRHTIRLTSVSSGSCDADPVEQEICIQNPPTPIFTLPVTTVCAPNTLAPVNSSITDIICSAVSAYLWTVTPAVSFAGNTSATSKDPIFNFTTAGTYTITLSVTTGTCGPVVSAPQTVIVQGANAGEDQKSICSGNTATLAGNSDLPGTWTQISGPTVVIDAPNQWNTAVNGIAPENSYTFRWTINGGACPGSYDEVTITYPKPIANNINTPSSTVCSGQSIVLTGDVPTGGTGVYAFQWQKSSDNTNWLNVTPGGTSQNLTATVTALTYFRRMVTSGVCISESNRITINALPAIANNSISANQTICIGDVVSSLTGTLPTGADGSNFSYQWQQSLDGTTWADITAATAKDFLPPQPTVTIRYRRLVSSGACPGGSQNISNTVTITVNQPAKAEIIFTTDIACAPFLLTAANIKAGNYPQNATYTWFANNVQIGTGATFPGYTITAGNASTVIKLAVTTASGCGNDEASHTFSTFKTVTPNFTQNVTDGCGPLSLIVVNTSSSLTDATFKWDFGNGVTSNLTTPPTVVYQPDPLGKDITYTITLDATTPCGTITKTSTILVKALPISAFSPDKTSGCSPFTTTFSNTSPGNYTSFTYDFGDGTTLTTNDKNSVVHTYTTIVVKDYVVKMTARNDCGVSESQYTVRVSPNNIVPELVVNAPELRGCAPLTVNFFNNTKGGSTFYYDFGDGSSALTNTAPEMIAHTFTKPGSYVVTLYASNDCSNASTKETIVVLDQPTVAFTSDKTIGCSGTVIKFKNNSKNAVSYLWDFGDGTTSSAFEPEHVYTGAGQNFTVKLTTTNALGCTNTLILTDYIKIAPELKSVFTVLPGNELSIPNFTFSFRDASLNGAGSWEWNFGDGTVSTLQNPTHSYANVGDYTVTLKILNKEGCSATSSQAVRIIGVPGFLYVPNSFMPGSAKNELQTFKAKGRGIDNWTMTIFNKWGQVLWETTKLDDGAPLESWDGTYKGQPQPQGVYFWKIEVKFINGSEWKGMTYDSSPPKKTGNIYLIR